MKCDRVCDRDGPNMEKTIDRERQIDTKKLWNQMGLSSRRKKIAHNVPCFLVAINLKYGLHCSPMLVPFPWLAREQFDMRQFESVICIHLSRPHIWNICTCSAALEFESLSNWSSSVVYSSATSSGQHFQAHSFVRSFIRSFIRLTVKELSQLWNTHFAHAHTNVMSGM